MFGNFAHRVLGAEIKKPCMARPYQPNNSKRGVEMTDLEIVQGAQAKAIMGVTE